jgi:septation ring formation regulator EzrA
MSDQTTRPHAYVARVEELEPASVDEMLNRLNAYKETKRQLDEAQKEFSSIHRWIDRNQADGFIDSLTYLQNLERVTDDWYDRLDRLEVDACRFVRERDEATTKLAQISSLTESIVEKANALLARWDQPSWKDTAPTAGFINALRNAVEAYEKTPK